LSGQFLQRSLFVAVDAILGAIVTSLTPKCNDPTKIRGNYLKKNSSMFSLCRSRIMTELRSGTVDKMADIFTKFIWQPYSQSIHLYTVWKFFEPSIVGASWNWKANTMKNQCIDKKAFFLQYVFENPVPVNFGIYELRQSLHLWLLKEWMTGIFAKCIWQP